MKQSSFYSKNMVSIVTTLFLLCAFCNPTGVNAQETKPLPSIEELIAINDSIMAEGLLLYHYEKAAWLSADAGLENGSVNKINGSIVYACGTDSLKAIYYNKDENKCYFEYIYDLHNPNSYSSEPRELNEDEQTLISLKDTLLQSIVKEGLHAAPKEFGSLNFDFIFMDEGIIRVYVLQGTVKNKTIPFGNDCSFDFNTDKELIAKRKYHSSLIPISFDEDDNIRSIAHSHLRGNPYMTATDICTFLLYGNDIMKINTSAVYSPDYDKFFEFNSEKFEMYLIDENDTLLVSSRNEREYLTIDYNAIESFVKNNRDEYDALFKRFLECDTTLTADEMAKLYYGYTYTEGYFGYYSLDEKELNKMLEAEEYTKAVQWLQKEREKEPFNITVLNRLAISAHLAGNDDLAVKSFMQFDLIDNIIAASGNGTEEHPHHIIYVNDEYEVMRGGYRIDSFQKQTLRNSCDVMSVIKNGEPRDIWFDIHRVLLKKTF